MTAPAGVPNCPPGLEYLSTIDQLLVKQKVELLEVFTGFETNNKFTVKNSLGQNVIYQIFQKKSEIFFINFVFHLKGVLGCWREWLLYTKLLWLSASFWNENNGQLQKRSDSPEPTVGVPIVLLSMLFAIDGSLFVWSSARQHRTRMDTLYAKLFD